MNSLRQCQWVPAVGLEIHAQISARTKIFSHGRTTHPTEGLPPNSTVALFDIALPGSMPVLNKQCVWGGVLTAFALKATINQHSYFDRKHYFYPDLPAGYQITQHRLPLATGGQLEVPLENKCFTVQLKQLHLEQDSGKTIFGGVMHGNHGRDTLLDFNRAGVGLMEIVTQPDMLCGREAAAFVRELQLLLRSIGTCDGNMQDGSLRVDANISVRPAHQTTLGVRSEVKNISGLKFLAKAVDFEISRHIELLQCGEEVEEETRSFDEKKGCTVVTRGKSQKEDYCFMAEHDLPPLVIHKDSSKLDDGLMNIHDLPELPELPYKKRSRLVNEYGLTIAQCQVLMGEVGAVDMFEAVMSRVNANPQAVYHWITSELFGLLSANNQALSEGVVTHQQLSSLLQSLHDQQISGSYAKKILKLMADGDQRLAKEIMDSEESQSADASGGETVESAVDEVLNAYQEEVTHYQSGKTKLLGYFIGEVMKRTGRRRSYIEYLIRDSLVE